MEDAFEAMGGAAGLTAWALLNPGLFYLHIWSKLIPKAVAVDASVSHQPPPPVFNAVNVADVGEALNALERLRGLDTRPALELQEASADSDV